MNGRLRASIYMLRSSYWFIPSMMAIIAIGLGVVMIWVDARFSHGWIEGLSWYQQVRPEGAREILSTIAGSMITVAGVVFSITIVALSYASSQYGPRVLTNFMSDRGNTITLGTFIATFLYCLVVLRTIRGGDDAFVPQYAVFVAMLLAGCSIGVLIYFIHHVPQSIHINHVVARIGEQLIADTSERFPARIGLKPDGSHVGHAVPATHTVQVFSNEAGYIQSIDEDGILGLATQADALIKLELGPGDFTSAGRTLAEVTYWKRWDQERSDQLRACLTVGKKRTPENDLLFLVSELVEIAARALSPGVNDPMTAVTCLDWLGAGGAELAGREMPDAVRVDEAGRPRVIVQPNSFSEFLAESFSRLRSYVAGDVIASLHFLDVIGILSKACLCREQIDELNAELTLLIEQAQDRLNGPGLRAVQERGKLVEATLKHRAQSVTFA
ncbi:hypothetical protein GCM10011515_08870 [Tsuneonella deserti]|uniref:DUF2254 domain-containing protein n=2 Tax=Tsuneonella TaxID=2800686 RepID=A0A6I4TF11_9SPHN|nr:MULTISPECIES: DUF2254 domain-containing protein [Tsuneonella]MXO75018.1 DUF2254 domain-containing protein [Tsuneonella aeria]GGD91440.1 hypothetical protein GCM10011515_08870 [Tsuneonella deserti]